MKLAHFILKQRITGSLIAFLLAFALSTQAQSPSQNSLTEEDAREFMKEYLWYSTYGYMAEDRPTEKVLEFFPDSLQSPALHNAFISFRLQEALISSIDLPYVEVLVAGPSYLAEMWEKTLTFELGKKDGKIFIIPGITHKWDNSEVLTYKAERYLKDRVPSPEEKHQIKQNFLEYIAHSQISPEAIQIPDETLLKQTWYLDSIFYDWRRDWHEGVKADVIWRFEADEILFKESIESYSGSSETPEWWKLSQGKLLTSNHMRIDAFEFESISENRMVIRELAAVEPRRMVLVKERRFHQPKASRITQELDEPDIQVVLQPTYDRIYLSDRESRVYKQEKQGLIDSTGALILPPEFDQIFVAESGNEIEARKGSYWLGFDGEGNFLDTLGADGKYRNLYSAPSRYEQYQKTRDFEIMIIRGPNNLYGVIDSSHRVLHYPTWDMIHKSYGHKGYELWKDDKMGYMTKQGKVLLPAIYTEIHQRRTDSMLSVGLDGKQGIFDTKSETWILPTKYTSIDEIGSYYQVSEEDKMYLLDENKEKISLPVDQNFEYLGEDLIGIFSGFKKGIITFSGKQILPTEYDIIQIRHKLIAANKEGKWGLFDMQGNSILPFEYEALKMPYPRRTETENEELEKAQYLLATKNNKEALLDRKGKLLIDFKYEELGFPHSLTPHNKHLWVRFKDQGKVGFLNIEGEVVIPAIYDDTWFTGRFSENGYGIVQKDGKVGMINTENKEVIPFIFDRISEVRHNPDLLLVKYEGHYGLIQHPGVAASTR